MSPLEAVAFMKAHKILSFRDGNLELTLSPDALTDPAPPGDEEIAGPSMSEVGRTGMTRAQQLELYGRIYEPDFKNKGA